MAKAPAKKAAASSSTKSGGTTQTKSKSSGSSSSSNGSSSNGMGAQSSAETGQLEKYFVDGLKDIYWAEKALTKALPKLMKAATTEQLKSAFKDHLAVTKEQVVRLEQVFEGMGKKAQAKKCDAMEGLIKESESIIEDTKTGSLTRDVALIMAAQKVEHYEIATYGSLAQLAKTLGYNDISDILERTLAEEKEADQLLTTIAENSATSDDNPPADNEM